MVFCAPVPGFIKYMKEPIPVAAEGPSAYISYYHPKPEAG